jgi:hypothetical protein
MCAMMEKLRISFIRGPGGFAAAADYSG